MPLALMVLGNLLPLMGVLLIGWDIYTLLVYYWCETLFIAFWTAMAIAFQKGGSSSSGDAVNGTGSTTAAILVTLHAGFFIAIHLLLMSTLYGGHWPGHLDSPLTFIQTFAIGQGLWPMLVLRFLQGGAMFWEARAVGNLPSTIVGLYMRIFVIQVVIVVGAWGIALLDSGLIGLTLLVTLKTMLDLSWPRIFAWIDAGAPEVRRE